MTPSEGNGWDKWKENVLYRLDSNDSNHAIIQRTLNEHGTILTQIREDIAAIKGAKEVKKFMWSIAIPASIALLGIGASLWIAVTF